MFPSDVEQPIPPPPRLQWWWVLVLTSITGGLFGAYWFLKQARWSRSVHRVSQAYGWALVYLGFSTIGVVLAIADFVAILTGQSSSTAGTSNAFLAGANLILFLVVGFGLQSEFEGPPIEMKLSGWMVFFWGPVYLQYWLGKFSEAATRRVYAPIGPVA